MPSTVAAFALVVLAVGSFAQTDTKGCTSGETKKRDCNTCYCTSEGIWICTPLTCATPGIGGCGGLLSYEEGTLTFPDPSSGSDYYPNSMSCAWVIITNSTKVLNVTFTNFHLEHSAWCAYDSLQVYDGKSAEDPLIGRFCGFTAPGGGHLISSHNALYLWFRSDSTVTREGFSLTWNSLQPAGGQATRVRRSEGHCTPNETFKKDCNTCTCNRDGTAAVCTLKACLPHSTKEVSCTPGATYKDGCKICRCRSDGISGACTNRDCPVDSD